LALFIFCAFVFPLSFSLFLPGYFFVFSWFQIFMVFSGFGFVFVSTITIGDDVKMQRISPCSSPFRSFAIIDRRLDNNTGGLANQIRENHTYLKINTAASW
jgi:hypothetical protein